MPISTIETIQDVLRSTKNVDKFGELAVLAKLSEYGYKVEWHGGREPFDILADGKKIEVKSCNYDNEWATKSNLVGGWDRINPAKFDYLVCVSFNKDFENVRYFIFTNDEARKFEQTKWKTSRELKGLVWKKDVENPQMADSENNWSKIR
ncbi:MAG: hypothetical protein RL681_242 [Candidatus Parcubacteria bacterium]|jgi:hypothetical protein